MGSRFPTNRYPQFPVEIQVGIEAQIKDIASGSLAALLCSDQPSTIEITLADPACGNNVGADKVRYTVVGAKQTSQPISVGVQGNGQVSLNFTSTIGGPTSVSSNLFISGSIN